MPSRSSGPARSSARGRSTSDSARADGPGRLERHRHPLLQHLPRADRRGLGAGGPLCRGGVEARRRRRARRRGRAVPVGRAAVAAYRGERRSERTTRPRRPPRRRGRASDRPLRPRARRARAVAGERRGTRALRPSTRGEACDGPARARPPARRSGARRGGDRLGELDEATELLDCVEEHARGSTAPGRSRAARAAAALLAAARGDDAAADAAFALRLRAARAPAAAAPDLRARAHAARARLDPAPAAAEAAGARGARAGVAIFERLGARIYAERARSELARIGGRAAAAGDELSETERQIADLVAKGRSNKEVAAALSLSPKTVEWNLSKVYAKLGVRSRAELASRRAEAIRGSPRLFAPLPALVLSTRAMATFMVERYVPEVESPTSPSPCGARRSPRRR